jgi:hypothetical protein
MKKLLLSHLNSNLKLNSPEKSDTLLNNSCVS